MKGSRTSKNRTQSPKVLHQIEDFNLEKRRKDRESDLAQKKVKDLTIAERLTLSALERIISVPFEDSHGEFAVKMHTPLRSEFDEIVRLQDEIKSKEPERIEKASDTFFRMLASLCVDDTLNYEFWNGGAYDPMDMIRLMNALTSEMAEKVQEAQSFRKK